MTRVILVRHGESEGNLQRLFRGRCDFPLTPRGVEQARALRDELANFNIDAIYTSPLQRALKTAEIINERHNVPIFKEDGFINIDLGEWQGKPRIEIERNYPELWKLWITTPEELRIKGGEPLDNVQQRAYNTLVKLIRNHTDGTIVIVTHRAVLKPLIARAIGIAKPYFWKIHIDTASYSILEYTDERGFYLTLLNQTKHLHEFIRELT